MTILKKIKKIEERLTQIERRVERNHKDYWKYLSELSKKIEKK